MQVFGIKKKQTKYYCCDCGKKLSARAKTPEWRKIPAQQKRCRSCSSRHRGFLRRTNAKINEKTPLSENLSDKNFTRKDADIFFARRLKHSKRLKKIRFLSVHIYPFLLE
jgi:hypothetical protein